MLYHLSHPGTQEFFLSFNKPGYGRLVEYSEIGTLLRLGSYSRITVLFLHIPKLLFIFLCKLCFSALHLKQIIILLIFIPK